MSASSSSVGSPLVLWVLAGLASSCSSTEPSRAPAQAEYVFQTEQFNVAAGTEKYECFTKTTTEDMWFDHITYESDPSVHHGVLVRTLAPEPDQPFECNVLAKTTWIPLFGNGVSNSSLEVPKGASFAIPKGTQLLVQLHLLNPGSTESTGTVRFSMRRTAKTASEAGIFAFGTTVIDLPPGQTTAVTNDCTVQQDLDIFAVLPHMHRLGKTLVLESGPDALHLTEQFRVDPWDFGDQYVRSHVLHLKVGDLTRTTCTYDNTTSSTVSFGESTNDEMCFLPTFRTDYAGLSGCLDLSGWRTKTDGGAAPVDASLDAAACTNAVTRGNEKGIGAPCTKGGMECGTGLSCTLDLQPDATLGFCMQVGGCAASTDCGSGATCCAPAQGGGAITICVPEACRPADCTPK